MCVFTMIAKHTSNPQIFKRNIKNIYPFVSNFNLGWVMIPFPMHTKNGEEEQGEGGGRVWNHIALNYIM